MRLFSAAFLLATIAVPAVVNAQAFTPGYIVADGDTLRGEVALGTEAENAAGVRFRRAIGAEAARYVPAGASAFGVDAGRQYRRGDFDVAPKPDLDPALPDTRRAFARVARDGAADLLALELADGEPLFFLQTDGAPVGLYFVDRRVATGTGLRYREARFYRPVVARLLGGACVSPGETDRLPYTEAALARVVDAFNACADPGYVVAESPAARARREPVRIGFEIDASAVRGTLARGGSFLDERTDPDISTAGVGAAAEVSQGGVLRLVVGVGYEPTVAQLAFGGARLELGEVGVLGGRLGLRVVPRVGPVRVRLGVGLSVGRGLARVAATDIDRTSIEDLDQYSFTTRRSFRSAVGRYAEIAAGHRALPVDVFVRGQTVAFADRNPYVFFVPASSRFYVARTVSVGLVARF